LYLLNIKKADNDESQFEDPATTGEIPKSHLWRWEVYAAAAGIASMLLLAAVVVYFWENVQSLGSYGYIGAFIISILGGGTIFVPIPHVAVIFALGGVMPHPALVGAAAGLGESIGELTGYLAGFGGRRALRGRSQRLYSRLVRWMKVRGPLVTMIAAMFPNPMFDLVGATAGALRLSLWKFLLACWAGKTVKGMAVAYAGAWGLGFVIRWLSGFGVG
jgi:membrane protein YqaA with SNARE-associated domain